MIDAYFPVAKHKDTPIAGIGAPGKDGFSPAVSISSITGGHRVTITDKSGEHSFDVLDGVGGGSGGGAGTPGVDGFSPTVSISSITGGHRVIITDKNGAHSFDVLDGKDGAAGSGGVTIDPTLTELEFLTPDDLGDISEGKTPVKGVDYFTDSDKAEFVQSVLAALPTWNGGSF